QLVLAALGVTAGLLIAYFFTTAERRGELALAVASIVPAVLVSLPSGGLQAAENGRHNVIGSPGGLPPDLVGLPPSRLPHWALVGVLASLLISRTVDCVLRFILYRRVYSKIQFPEGDAPLDPALRKRLLHFASRQLVQIAFQILLWERMEVFLIKWKATTRD